MKASSAVRRARRTCDTPAHPNTQLEEANTAFPFHFGTSCRRRLVMAGWVVVLCVAGAACCFADTWSSGVDNGWSWSDGKTLSDAGILSYIQSLLSGHFLLFEL